MVAPPSLNKTKYGDKQVIPSSVRKTDNNSTTCRNGSDASNTASFIQT